MKVLKYSFITITFAILLLCLSIAYFLKAASPTYMGEVKTKFLKDKVEVLYDNNGIPHIYAQNRKDLMFTLGRVIASERLFQMDVHRRVGRGELSEVFGNKTIGFDKLSRTIGFKRNSEVHIENSKKDGIFNQQMWDDLENFYSGVNSFIDEGNLPIEFKLLGYTPKKFEPIDAYAFTGYMGYSFSRAIKADMFFSDLKSNVKYAIYNQMRLEIEKNFKISNSSVKTTVDNTLWELIDLPRVNGYGVFEGSNSWVLGPNKTKSGSALLANDPHISYSLPGIWFEAHLNTPDFNLYGNFLPLVPFAAIGHNSNYAWAVTMSKIDDGDVYKEKLNEDATKVMYKNNWIDLKTHKEKIKVKGAQDQILTVKETPHGPLLDEMIKEKGFSFKWVFSLPNNYALNAFYETNHAKNMEEFKKALSLGASPGLNISYADSKGNIGWWIYGRIPKRPEHIDSHLVLRGDDGSAEYDEYYSFKDNPHIENPEEGFIVTANARMKVTGDHIAGMWEPSDRHDTINKIISGKEKWSIEETKELQSSSKNIHWEIIRKLLVDSILPNELDTDIEKNAYLKVKEWNMDSSIKSTGASIFHMWVRKTRFHLFDEIEVEKRKKYCKFASSWESFKRLIHDPKSDIWDRPSTPDQESRDDIFRVAFKDAVLWGTKKWGNDIKKWQWGDIHHLTFPHPLGAVKPLNYLFNVGPLKVAGKFNTINNMKSPGCDGEFEVKSGPSVRRIIDFSDPSISYNTLPLGNSGHIFSPFYANELKNYINGTYRKQFINRRDVERNLYSMQVFTP